MKKNPLDLEQRRAFAYSLKAQVQALGGVGGEMPGFIEDHPDIAIDFYREVLAQDRQVNGLRPDGKN